MNIGISKWFISMDLVSRLRESLQNLFKEKTKTFKILNINSFSPF